MASSRNRTASFLDKPTSEGSLIYTSNFASIKSLPPHIRPISTAIGPPGWFKGEQELRLAPTRAMLSMDWDEYDDLYIEILNNLDPQEIYDSLTDNENRTVAMLCWCKRGECCHRRYAAEWLEAHIGIVIPEFGMERSQLEQFFHWVDPDDTTKARAK